MNDAFLKVIEGSERSRLEFEAVQAKARVLVLRLTDLYRDGKVELDELTKVFRECMAVNDRVEALIRDAG